jgi:anhydro-N-acetylmuramic acid kinase
MVYHVIGLMSGSSLDGLDIAFCKIEVQGQNWNYELLATDCIHFPEEWKNTLSQITQLSLPDFFKAHTAFGHWMGQSVNQFIEKNSLHHKVNLIASHGHTAFHFPANRTSVQIGCGAAIAAITGIATVSDLRAMDMAVGGQGAPIVPIAEQLLFPTHTLFLNIGGICNISLVEENNKRIAFDIAPANRVLNELVKELNLAYDEDGALAANGFVNLQVLKSLNELDYYKLAAPKSLANEFGLEKVLPILQNSNLVTEDKLATMVSHIAYQIGEAIPSSYQGQQLLITGGGALNKFLIGQIQKELAVKNISVHIPDEQTVQYKEALAMALIGVLRWREEVNVLSSVTGASQDSIGGALWMVN